MIARLKLKVKQAAKNNATCDIIYSNTNKVLQQSTRLLLPFLIHTCCIYLYIDVHIYVSI